jgi:hypothetical protein
VALSLDDAVAGAATGDVWLFRGRSFADVAIRTVTNAPVNHVGMVVALDDLPPLLWHAELGRSLPDVWTGERQRGVQLHVLARRGDDVGGALRPARLAAPARGGAGPRARGPADGGRRPLRRPPVPDDGPLARSWASARFRRRAHWNVEAVYCAELVATTYQRMGLLPPDRPASWYDPGRFWSGDRIELVAPFRLGAEVAVERAPA